MAQPSTLERAAAGGRGLGECCGTAAAPCPQPAPLGSAGGEHLSSGVVLFSVSLALKAIKWFFYLLLLIIILLLVNTILLKQIISQAAAWLYSAQVGTAQDTCTQPALIFSSWGGGNLYELLPQSLRKRRPPRGGGLTAALGDLRATAGMTEPSSSQGWMWPCHPALVPSPSSPEPPLQPGRLAATRCVNWHSPTKTHPPKKNPCAFQCTQRVN